MRRIKTPEASMAGLNRIGQQVLSVDIGQHSTGFAYRGLAISELAFLIGFKADSGALPEILSRRCFLNPAGGGDQHINLPTFCRCICSSMRRDSPSSVWDEAYDLMIEKFSRLPTDDSATGRGVDCRNYYRALYQKIEFAINRTGDLNGPEREQLEARLFQQFVGRQILRSYDEALRKVNPFVSRFNWSPFGNGTITVYMPRYLVGQARRKWLENNVSNPDPSRPNERARVQSIINAELQIPNFVSFDDGIKPPGFSSDPIEDDDDGPDIARFVAREKAVRIKEQRPAIRTLKPRGIEELVVAVFESIETGERSAKELAQEFGISESTLSRFAGHLPGSNGRKEGKDIGDLWKNLAEILAQDPRFKAAAERAGVLDKARTVADANERQKGRRDHQ